MKRTLGIIVIVLVIAALVAGGYLLYKKDHGKNSQSSNGAQVYNGAGLAKGVSASLILDSKAKVVKSTIDSQSAYTQYNTYFTSTESQGQLFTAYQTYLRANYQNVSVPKTPSTIPAPKGSSAAPTQVDQISAVAPDGKSSVSVNIIADGSGSDVSLIQRAYK